MNTRYFLFLALLSFLAYNSLSQNTQLSGSHLCSDKKTGSRQINSLGWDSPNSPQHSYDVLNYQIFLDLRSCFLSPYPKSYSGNVIVKFMVDTALNSITLNAVNSSLQITSVGLSGVSFSQANDILTVILNRTYNQGETVFVQIFFNHLNVYDNAFYATNGMVFTDCEPMGARNWFPCWDLPSDKATTDITIKGPAAARIGSNGRLNDSTVTGDTIYYHWISRDPVATYLITIIGRINFSNDIMYWHKISNPNDSIPARFYYSGGENPSSVKNVILDMTTYYSQLFGEYPFEKIGFSSVPSSFSPWCGGMENQTLINFFCAIWSAGLTSHEFAHQWFGDMITCGTWADIWLNEGFATYCEALYVEHTSGYNTYKSYINSDASYYLSHNPGWAIYNPGQLFNEATTYDKGACVLHMLRYTLGDSTFFALLKAYATDTANFKYKAAVTDDFTTKVSQVAGQDMSWFVNEWVKQPNHPTYVNSYNVTPSGSNWNLSFTANQTQTNTVFHKMPIVIKVSFSSGPDSNISLMNDQNNQQWNWTFNRQPTTVVFDPNNDIVLKTATMILGITKESEKAYSFALSQNYPNPFNPATVIKFDLPEKAAVTLKVYNVLGELVSVLLDGQKLEGSYKVKFDGTNLSSGIYYYELNAAGSKNSFNSVKKMVLIK
jgi:aminopeptidase N